MGEAPNEVAIAGGVGGLWDKHIGGDGECAELAQRLAKLGTEIEVASVVAKRQHRLSGKGG